MSRGCAPASKQAFLWFTMIALAIGPKPLSAAEVVPLSAPTRGDALLPGEKEALVACKRHPPNERFKWALRGEVDLISLVNAISPMTCRPFIVPGQLRQSKASIIAPDTMTTAEAYRLFLAAIESIGLTVEPEGKMLKIVAANQARSDAIPVFGPGLGPPPQDQYVTRLLHLDHASADELKGVLDRLKGRDAEVMSYAPTDTLIITDLGTNIHKLEEVIRQLDVALGGEKIYVIKLHSVAAKEMADLVSNVFSVGKRPTAGGKVPHFDITVMGKDGAPPGKGGRVAISRVIPEDRLNMLILVATEHGFSPVLALVRRLDDPTAFGHKTFDRIHVIPIENANADDIAATLDEWRVRRRRTCNRRQANQLPHRVGCRPRLPHTERTHPRTRLSPPSSLHRGNRPRNLRRQNAQPRPRCARR